MKKVKLGLIILGIILLTGCVKYDLQMNVGSDKSFTLTMIDAVQNEYYTETEDDTTKSEYEALGYEVEEYKTSTHTGLKISKKYDSIDALSSSDCGQVELTSILELNSTEVTLFKSSQQGTITTYTADFTYDLTVETTSEESEEVDYSEYSETMEFTYSIALPTNATIISNNADKISSDGYVLTWTMEYGSKKDIDFVFTIDESKTGENTTIEDDNKEEAKEETEEPIVEEDEITKQNTESEGFSLKTLITSLLAIAIILGLILLKIKTYSNSKANSKNNISSFNHTLPPNNK